MSVSVLLLSVNLRGGNREAKQVKSIIISVHGNYFHKTRSG